MVSGTVLWGELVPIASFLRVVGYHLRYHKPLGNDEHGFTNQERFPSSSPTPGLEPLMKHKKKAEPILQ